MTNSCCADCHSDDIRRAALHAGVLQPAPGLGCAAGAAVVCNPRVARRKHGRRVCADTLPLCQCAAAAVISGKAVPAANMGNHTLHCYRHVCRCAMCGAAVPVRERSEHVEEAKGDG